MRAATYVRLSASRLGEDAPGLDRQRDATERLIRERGWDLDDRHRFQDADTSAFTGAARPGFEELRRAVRVGEVQAVVVWKLDRAFRSITDAADFLRLIREHGATFVSSSEGIDTSTSFGPVLFSLFSAMAELESQTRSDRITEWHAQRAALGLPSGGGSRPFGFKADRVTHEPTEARLIRRAMRDLLSGRTTLTGIKRNWTERGVRTPTGGTWTKTTVRRLLLSPRVAGLRQHNGARYSATWRPIISEDEHVRLHELFDGREPPAPGRWYLLSGGLGVCGLCGERLVARPRADGRRAYICSPDRGCGKIRILADPLEELVANASSSEWERRLQEADAKGETWPPQPPPPEDEEALRRELAADEAALEQLARDHYVARSISEAEFRAAREPLVARIGEAQQRLARRPDGRRTFLQKDFEPVGQPWEDHRWREYVAEVVEKVEVGPGVRGRNFFDPDRVKIRWHPDVPPRPTPGDTRRLKPAKLKRDAAGRP